MELWSHRLTPVGRAIFWAGILISFVANTSFVVKSYLLFALLLGIAISSLALARLARVRLDLEWSPPERSACGLVVQVPITVRNRRKRAAVEVAVRPELPRRVEHVGGEREVYLPRVEPGQTVEATVELRMHQRGAYDLNWLRQDTYYPLGVWRDVVRTSQPRRLLVYPAFQPLTTFDVPVGRRYHPGGIILSSNVGDSTEFIGTRDFRPGDNVRDIHWKSWGRVGRPVVKEFQEEYFCRIAILLDTYVGREEKKRRPAFEASLSLAAACGDALGRGEYVVDLFAAGPELYSLRAGRNLAHLDNVLDVLACLEPCAEPPFDRLTPVLLDNLGGITTVILIMLDWDESRRRLVQIIQDYGAAVRLLLVRDGPCTFPPDAGDLAISVLSSEDVRQGVDHL